MSTRLLFVMLLLCVSPLAAWSATWVVNVTYDGVDHDPNDNSSCDADPNTPNVDPNPMVPDDDWVGQCTLRAAIQAANLTPELDNIELDLDQNVPGPAATFELTLTGSGEDEGLTGDLDITSQIRLASDETLNRGFESMFIDAKRLKDRIFDVHPGATFTIGQVSLLNGRTPNDDFDPGAPGEVSGGCIRSAGFTTLNSVYFYRCTSSDDGGGASAIGGTWSATNVNFGLCKAKNEGGGFEHSAGTATLLRNTFGENRAATGGGLATRADLEVRNSTFDANRAKLGGGIAVLGAGATTIAHATLSENAKSNLDASQNTGALVVLGSILWGAKTDCVGNVPSGGGNLEGGTSCGFTGTNDQQSQDPLLAPLNFYGGLVPTRTLASDSPAIDHGLDDEGACELDARLKYRACIEDENDPGSCKPGGVAISDAGATDFAVPGSGPVEITSTAITSATVGVPYSYDVEAENPLRESCISFALTTFAVPDGMTIDAVSGVIAWTPAPGQEGDHPLRVEATSKGASLDTQTFTITVAP
jgi:hypothetical protein